MTWSEEVHARRVSSTLIAARKERILRKKGLPVPVEENAEPGPFTAFLGAAVVFVLWRKYEKRIQAVNWKSLPVIKQFHSLLFGNGVPAPVKAVSKSTGSNNSQPKIKPRPAAAPAVVSQPNQNYKPASKVSVDGIMHGNMPYDCMRALTRHA